MFHFFQVLRKAFTLSTKTLLWLVIGLIVLHTTIIHWVEHIPWFDSLWLTMTTITTVGYGDLSAKTFEGRLATMILMYVGGVFLLAKVASNVFEEFSNRQELKRKGLWSYNMKNHIVIVGHPSEQPLHYLRQLISQIKLDARYSQTPIVIVSNSIQDAFELEELRESCTFVQAPIHSFSRLDAANILDAQAIFFIAPSSADDIFDSQALDIISLLREKGCKAYIISECVKATNHRRLQTFGANAVLHVLHGFPSIIARALTVKESYKILHNVFGEEQEELVRLDLQQPITKTWKEIVIYCMEHNYGTPLAALTASGEVIVSPSANTSINISAVFTIQVDQKHNTLTISM